MNFCLTNKILLWFCLTLCLFLLADCSKVYAANGVNSWSKRLGGTGVDTGNNIFTYNNKVVVVGSVSGDADLNGDGDRTDGGAESGTGYGNYDGLISVFNSSGAYLWSKRLGGVGTDQVWGISNGSDNNLIFTGTVSGDADLNGDGDRTDGGTESGTGNDIFVSVFNESGSFQWSKRLGGAGGDVGYYVTTDTNNNIIVTGYVAGDADLNGDGDSTDNGAESSIGYGGNDSFITVFNSDGIYQWSKRLGGTDSDTGYDITTDSHNNILVTGIIWNVGNADLNGDGDSTDGEGEGGTGYGSWDNFISVFDTGGNYKWSKRLGGTGSDNTYGVATDASNNYYVVGSVFGDADLNGDGDRTDGGAESSVGYGNSDTIISVFNDNGVYQWSKRFGGTSVDSGKSVSIDLDNNINIVGYVTGNADLNGDGDRTDGGGESGTGYGSYDIFISVFNSEGTYRWSKRLGGTSDDIGQKIVADTNNKIITGYVVGDADLNGDGDKTDGGAESSAGYGSYDIVVSVFSTQAPTISLTPLSPDPSSDTTPSLSGTATGVLGTVTSVEYQMDGTSGSWTACTSDDGVFDETSEAFTCATPSSSPLSDGSHTMYIRSTDSNTNTTSLGSETTDTFTIDTGAPADSGFRIGTSKGVNNSKLQDVGEHTITYDKREIKLYLSAKDSISDVAYMMVSQDKNFKNATWKIYDGDVKISFGKDGKKNIYFKFKDSAGNISDTYKQTLTIDTTPPTLTIDQKTPYVSGTSEEKAFIKLYVDNVLVKEYPRVSEDLKWSFPDYILPTGFHTIKVTAKDKAGNTSEASFSAV